MTSPRIKPVADPAELARACLAFVKAAGTIGGQMLPVLDQKRRDGVDAVLAAGGWLCVESAIDGVGATRITMTVVTAEGARHEIASVHVPDDRGVR